MLGNGVPRTAFSLMVHVYRRIFPEVKRELTYWKKQAERIPNLELRTQALASLEAKRFHCQGGAVYALLAGDRWKEAVRFIVAYQTISDYLDNLCDRSTSLDPDDFQLLHVSMTDALTPGNNVKNYYAHRDDQDDGGYLANLVGICQSVLQQLNNFQLIHDNLLMLAEIYGDLQVHKHVSVEQRIPRLTNWYETKKGKCNHLSWYEFSAAAGSTLGIFCLVSYTLGGKISEELAQEIVEGYFPYMQGLHILLDYYIDQQEDNDAGDLNFCYYYLDQARMKNRFVYFIEQTHHGVREMPNRSFHQMIHQGLLGLYLGDHKVNALAGGVEMRNELLKISGLRARFFYWNTRIYNKMKHK